MTHSINRRSFLRTAGLLLAYPVLATSGCAHSRFSTYPFTLGVASGSPLPDGFVIWTRLAPNPLVGGGLDPVPIAVHWEVATEENFRVIARRGTATADPHFAHSVHIEVDGLKPNRWYWYRFYVGDAVSPVGRTRTAPPASSFDTCRFAFASCQHYEQGFFAAHRHMADEKLDMVIFLGDYIYESSWGRTHVRKHEASEPFTLEQYRNRYARYKSDPDLQRCHASFPWIVTWDDHEVSNDYADDRSKNLDPNFLVRRAAAYQAFYEHMPLRATAKPRGPQLRLYDYHDFGRLARFYVLDDRQYRSYQACQPPGHGGSGIVENCEERMNDRRTLLGFEQEAWLRQSFSQSSGHWNILAQQSLMSQLNRGTGANNKYWTDSWDGYPIARRRLINDLIQQKVTNPLVIGGDIHANVVADVKIDFENSNAPVVATEFCGTSISSQGIAQSRYDDFRARNPHVKLARSDKRGYVVVDLDKHRSEIELRVIENEKKQNTPISTLARFIVETGRPGAKTI